MYLCGDHVGLRFSVDDEALVVLVEWLHHVIPLSRLRIGFWLNQIAFCGPVCVLSCPFEDHLERLDGVRYQFIPQNRVRVCLLSFHWMLVFLGSLSNESQVWVAFGFR